GGGALGGAHLAINRATHHPELAWQLVHFLTSDRAQLAIAEAVGLHPTKPKLLEPALRPIFAAARPRPITPWYQTLSATMQPAFSAAITGVTPPRDALATARRVTAVFTVASVALEVVLGVAAALALATMRRWRAAGIGLLLLPWCLPGVVTARIFEWLYEPTGWLGIPGRALPALIVADVWRTTPF